MIYLYTLPGINFNYPDIRNILYKTYLQENKIKYKFNDYTLYFLNKILINKNFTSLNIDIEQIKKDIKSKDKSLLDANCRFMNAINLYLQKFGLSFSNNRGFNYLNSIITMDDLILTSDLISNFMKLFPIDNYNNNDIIFFNVTYGFQVPMAICISKRIKNQNENVKIIWGGNYLTQINKNCYELINKLEFLDAIIIFNHVKTFKDIINYFSNKKVNLNNTILKNKKNPIIKDIKDDIKYYYLDYCDISLKDYLSRDAIMPLLLNYGCYHHQCKFCSHFYHYGNFMKMNFEKTCKMLKKEYFNNKFDSIVFVDECILPSTIIDFAKFLLDNNIKTKWMMETRISSEYLDLNKVKLLADSGLKFVSFGIESYNKRILKLMNKGINYSNIKTVLKNFYKNNIIVASTFMINYPKENYFNIIKTLFFISHFKYIDVFGLNIFTLTRNSELCDSMNYDYSDIMLTYRYKHDCRNFMKCVIKIFNQKKKIKHISNIKSNLLNRCDYFYLDINDFSINKRKV